MNKQRRVQIAKIVDKLETIQQEITDLRDTEQEIVDNPQDGLMGTEQYTSSVRAAGSLRDAATNLENVVTSLNSAINW